MLLQCATEEDGVRRITDPTDDPGYVVDLGDAIVHVSSRDEGVDWDAVVADVRRAEKVSYDELAALHD